MIDEIGDLLFAVVNLARKAGVQPEPALDRANRKFRERFEAVERLADAPRHGPPRRGSRGAGSVVGRGEGGRGRPKGRAGESAGERR